MLCPGEAEDKIMDALSNDYPLTMRILACEKREDFVSLAKTLEPYQKEAFAYNNNLMKYPTLMVDLIKTTKKGGLKLAETFKEHLPKNVMWEILSGSDVEAVAEMLRFCPHEDLLRDVEKYLLSYSEKTAWLKNPNTPKDCLHNFATNEKNSNVVAAYVLTASTLNFGQETYEYFILYGNANLQRQSILYKVSPEMVGVAMVEGKIPLRFYTGLLDSIDDESYKISCYEHYLLALNILDESMVGIFPAEYITSTVEHVDEEVLEKEVSVHDN